MRIFPLFLALMLLLGGCSAESDGPVTPPTLTDEVATFQGDGYILTYPAYFTLAGQTGQMVSFTVPGANMAFSVTKETHPYGELPLEEYPEAMGIYRDFTVKAPHSFGVYKHIPDMLSAYFLYTMTPTHQYLLEYTYAGTAEQKALCDLFQVTLTD